MLLESMDFGCASFSLGGCLIGVLSMLLMWRLRACLPTSSRGADLLKVGKGKTVKTMIFFGSGGHTTEMMRLVQNMNAQRYSPVCFAIGHTDVTSIDKVRSAKPRLPLEKNAAWLRVYRNREVKQSWLSTVFTSIWSLLQAFYVMSRYRPQLLICNGPGTCLSLCYSAFLMNILGISSTKIVFVESFCRVKALSLTGKLLLPIADKFIVQWPELQHVSSRAEYLGVLC